MHITNGLYLKNSAEAVRLYAEAFGLELGYHVLNADGSYYHSELCRDGQELFDVIEAPPSVSGGGPVQLGIILDSEEAVRRAVEALSDGGTVLTPVGPLPWSPCAAELRDKFGVWWYISAPQHYPSPDFDPLAFEAQS